MRKSLFVILVAALLAAFIPSRSEAQPPISATPNYSHDRFVTTPRDHVQEFQAYISSFDTNDDDDGDGEGESRGVPEWVSYHLKAGSSTGPASKPNKWRPVPGLPPGTDSPTDDSYRGSDYSRGHMCMRDHAHRLGSAANYHTFNVMNACPQVQAFNGGHWLGLEKLTGKWADAYGEVWIICGPIFADRRATDWIGDDEEVPVGVPERFFKIVIRESGNPDRPHVLAFIYDHDEDLNDSSQGVDHTEFLVSVDSIEAQTGLNFLTALADDVEEEIERRAATELWTGDPDAGPIPTDLVRAVPGLAAPRPTASLAAAGRIPAYVNGKATSIPDGDTVHILQEGSTVKVRLHAVDCPESDQPFGDKARDFTKAFVEGKSLTVRIVEKDRYGRLVGEVFADGRSLNRELARNGFAWWYERYASDDQDVKQLVERAKSSRAGLWREQDPIAPWDWRQGR